MANFAKPENALKRADELINVGQKQDALQALHDLITSKRYRAWQKPLEKIMFKYLDLCVDLKRGRFAKDGLIQYRIVCQQVNVSSLEEVIKHFLHLSTEKAEQARSQADALDEALDVDDLEADRKPEDLQLSIVSGEKGKDRSDRELVTPWFKFLWETYRTVLEILRNNSKLEALYAMTAHKAFQFCKQYKRTTEFRRLCEIIRNHLANLNKYRDQRDRPDLSAPESLQLYLDTRFDQLKVATELGLWQEAFRSVEDIYGLMCMVKKTPKSSLLMVYYSKLTEIFWISSSQLYHAYAWFKLFTLQKNFNKNLSQKDLQLIASSVVLAALSVPPFDRAQSASHMELENEKERNLRMANLIGFNLEPKFEGRDMLSRSALLSELVSRGVLSCDPSLSRYFMSLPTKRSTCTPAASSSSASTTDSSYSSPPPMKKSKNGLHAPPSDKAPFPMEDEDPTPSAANLSRKKATLPQPTKKLVIKLNKAKPTLPTNFEDTTWENLQSAIRAIFLKKPFSFDLERLYQAVDDLCLHKLEGKLYERMQKECEEHISAALQSLVGQDTDLSVFLSLVEKCWQDFCDQMLMIRSIALTLDRKYVIQNPNVRSLWEMGLQLFRKHLSLSPEVEQRTVTALLRMIEKERLAEAVNRTLLSHLLKMFTALGIYTESFEKPFLECTSGFYAAEGMKYMQQYDVPEYLKHVEGRLHEENEKCILYIDASTRKPLISTVEKQLLERHIVAILDKGFTPLMDGRRTEDLQRMYTLFSRVSALESMRQALSSYTRKTGQKIVMDEEKDKDMVQSLLDFKASLDIVWEDSFGKNESFGNTIKDSFEHLINLRQNRPAELIAKFLDEKLRAGNKGTSEEELESTLEKVLVLFRFIQGKDVFEAFYKKDLAKRLLLGKSASIDAEKSMISKLKTECGSQFTNKLEGMFKDIELSKEINESFKQSSQARTKLPSGIEMSVHVLTTGYWPTYPPMDVKLPHELNVYQDIFKEFYLSKYSGRRLMWQNSLGHCVLKADFSKGKKELAVSLFQAVVLMLFNDAMKLSFEDIKDSTGIEDKELRRTLQSLACGKVRVLQKYPKGRDVQDGDEFDFNDTFTAPLYRIKVNAIQMKETVEENTSTTERVFQDRQYQIDAAIVRIMKTRKVLSHTLLITELFQQLKFPIKPADLKKRIESLIDREYLERDKTNPQIYNYLA